MSATLLASADDVTPEDAAQMSGLSIDTVYRHIATGRLRARQIGGRRGRIWISRADLYDWLGHSAAKPTERLSDTDWSVPADWFDPKRHPQLDYIDAPGEHNHWLPVHGSRQQDFGAACERLGL